MRLFCCTLSIMHWERLAAIRTVVLILAGFALIGWGAFLIYRPAGFIVAGVALLAIEFLTGPDGGGHER